MQWTEIALVTKWLYYKTALFFLTDNVQVLPSVKNIVFETSKRISVPFK